MKRILLLFVTSVLFSGMMFAQDYHWADFDYHDYMRPMIVISRVQFNGEFQNRSDIEVAAFVGDELRGRSFLFEPYPNSPIAGQYFAYAPCYYDVPGETFTFKAYDHSAELEYDICSTQLVGQDDGHGSVENPIILDFSRTEEPTYGPEYPWAASTAYNGEGMVVVAQIMINGVLVDRGSYEVGAFCGEECRATSGTGGLDDWTDVELGYFAFMNVMGNDGDIINFYLHDLENNCNFAGICTTEIELENGAEVGIDIFGGDIFVLNFVTQQTTSFVEGWNWFSTNVEITMNDLKAALVEALPGTSITIKSQTQNTTYNPDNHRWTGQLNTLDVAYMYKIYVANDCEISLTNTPINPTEHPITITNGVNWIAFPIGENMTLNEAFDDFAVSGDVVKSMEANAIRSGNSWRGNLNTLVPWKGYIYKSSVLTDRIFTYPVSTK